MDVGCYCVHSSRVLGGEPERVYAEQVVGPTGVDVRFHGTMRFPSGVVAVGDCGMVMPERDELEAIGGDGLALPRRPVPLRRAGHRAPPRRGAELIEVEPADPYGLELENLSDAIQARGAHSWAARTRWHRRG